MDSNQLKIVCYLGGTCGDLITAMIDQTGGVQFRDKAVKLPDERSKLKKPHLFNSDNEKDLYLNTVGEIYQSIPSHNLEYHVKKRHRFISIVVTDMQSAYFAAKRFHDLHRPHVWQEMQKFSGADTVGKYAQMMIDYSSMIKENNYTDILIDLKKILEGQAADELMRHNISVAHSGKTLYNNWLDLQNTTHT